MCPSPDVETPIHFSCRGSARIRARTVRRLAMAAGVVAVFLFSGCASPPKPTVVSATLLATATVNPDAHKRPSPLVVRVYELKSTAAFDPADFVSLFERDQATLAAEMASREEFVLRPGETRLWEKTVGPDSRFIGVMAAFRDIERARWKTIVEIKPNVKNVITIQANEISVTANVVPQ